MNELLNQLLEKAKTNPKILKNLIQAAESAHDFGLAGQLMSMADQLFPDTPEQLAAKEQGGNLELVLRMVGIQSTNASAWLVAETMKLYAKKKGKFDLMDGAKLQARQKELFGE